MASIYALLIVGGVTMVYPFMVMVTGSVSNPFDYNRRSMLPRFLWSREDRFMRVLASYFPATHRASVRQLRSYFPDFPEDFQTWAQIGDETTASDRWARKQLAALSDPHLQAAASDYREFVRDWDLRETVLAYDYRNVGPFLRERYGTLERYNKSWEVSIDDFSKVSDSEWSGEPIDQQCYVPEGDARDRDLLEFRRAYRENRFTPYLRGEGAPAGYLRPASLRYVWEEKLAEAMGGRIPQELQPVEFPVSSGAPSEVRRVWLGFLATEFPVRHIQIEATEQRKQEFQRFVAGRFRNIDYLNRVLETSAGRWEDVKLTPTVPDGKLARVWMDFVRTSVPIRDWVIRDTLPDKAFQEFALRRHSSLAGVNSAYGLKLHSIRQLGIPFRQAALVTFANREWPMTLDGITSNYTFVLDFLLHRGRAVQNTVILVLLTMFFALTVNPLAGYALSRFRLRWTERIIVFCLVTMAFPAAVIAIPGFLLLRDFHLLNTFWALVLPGAANGMTIFLLKGFFDSLPKELYEAATIDGAHEWRIFWQISIPLVKPILAVSLLGAFITAYNGWEWAIIVCQDPKMWTVAVWTYQFFQLTGSQPSVMAAFIVNSIPVLLVFLFCQKVILRGIILPQMK